MTSWYLQICYINITSFVVSFSSKVAQLVMSIFPFSDLKISNLFFAKITQLSLIAVMQSFQYDFQYGVNA